MAYKTTQQWLREMGAKDAQAGRSIDSFYELELSHGIKRYTERYRGEYEIGYRAAKDEMRKAAGKARRGEQQ